MHLMFELGSQLAIAGQSDEQIRVTADNCWQGFEQESMALVVGQFGNAEHKLAMLCYVERVASAQSVPCLHAKWINTIVHQMQFIGRKSILSADVDNGS
jgi:hypothetical protein